MDINDSRKGKISPKSQAIHNYAMERGATLLTKRQKNKKYRDIINEIGVRNITLQDINDGSKDAGLLNAIISNGGSLDDMVIAKIYAKTILEGDIRGAEFLRDTKGEKPSTQVEVTSNDSGLSQMSLEDLMELKESLSKLVETDEGSDVDGEK